MPHHHRRRLCRDTAGGATGLGLHSATGSPLSRTPPSRSYRGTGVYPLLYIYGEDKDEVFPGSTGYLHRGTHIDPNNGTRARLPLCNPNRVKTKLKRDRGGGCYCLPVTTATARGEKKSTAVLTGAQQEKSRSLFGSENRKGKRILRIPTLTLIG